LPVGPNRLVAHFKDGHVLKGHSIDFNPSRPTFHLALAAAQGEQKVEEVLVEDLKALFFVKDFSGDPSRSEKRSFDPAGRYIGKKLMVKFHDGEILAGTRQAFNPAFPGFFLNPVDPESNTMRAFIINSAVVSISEQ